MVKIYFKDIHRYIYNDTINRQYYNFFIFDKHIISRINSLTTIKSTKIGVQLKKPTENL